MRRDAVHRTDEITLWLFERIIRWYARYAVLRCARHTNSRAQAERIAVHALVMTCLLTGELKRVRQLGLLIDVMVDVVAGEIIPGIEFRQGLVADETDVLLHDEPMRDVAQAMSQIEPGARDVLVLYHMEDMTAATLARIFATSPEEIRAEINRGEASLLERLHEIRGEKFPVPPLSAGSLLDECAARLDPRWIEAIGDCVVGVLARCGDIHDLRPADWTLN